jgi:hypothetical protein
MTKPQDLIDVVPFRDVAMTIQTTVANATALGIATTSFPANALGPTFHYSKPVAGYFGGPWEKFSTLSTNVGVPSLRVLPRYADPTDVNNTNGMQPTEFYQCAWGPYEMNMRPTMIRITVTLDDPNSRLAEGQTFQYVFKLP